MPKLIHLSLVLVAFSAVVLSCRKPEDSSGFSRHESSSSTPVQANLVHSRLLGGPDTFGRVQEIRPIGDYVVATDRAGPPHVTVFDRISGNILRRFGNSGRGPREFRGVHWLFTESHSPPLVWLYDYVNRRVTLLDLDAPDSLVVSDQFRFEVPAQITSPGILGDTILAGGFYPDMVLLLMEREGTVLSRIRGDLPFKEDDVEIDVALMQLNANSTAFDPSRKRVAIAYQRVNRIDFFTIDGAQTASAAGPRTIPEPKHSFAPDGSFLWEEMTPVYVDVDASDQYVYALFKGSAFQAGVPARLSYRVDVFTWDGDYVTELIMDHDLNEIAVTEDDSFLYGASQDPFPAVVEWRLPDWLRGG